MFAEPRDPVRAAFTARRSKAMVLLAGIGAAVAWWERANQTGWSRLMLRFEPTAEEGFEHLPSWSRGTRRFG